MDKVATRFPYIRRIGVTVAALAVTVGVVWLMQYGAKRLVEGGSVESSSESRPAVPDRVPAPRQYDLAKLVPPALKANLGGMELASITKRMPMPLELAMKQSEAEARSAGWEEMSMPLAHRLATLVRFNAVYVTPDRRIVSRSFVPLVGSETMREDLVLPASSYMEMQRDLTLDEITELHAARIAELIPEPLSAARTVSPLFTQLTSRGDGASLIVIGFSPLNTATVAAQIDSAFRRTGWASDRERRGGWIKANLSAAVDVSPREGGPDADGSVVTFRFSDDEVLLSGKENENEQ